MILKIIKTELFFLLCILLSANTLLANLRAPWSVSRYPSYALSNPNAQLVVMKENLVFKCDRAYEGDGNLSRIIEKNCKVEAIYFIQSTADASYALEFVLPSDKIVTTSVNDAALETTLPNLLNVSDLEKEGYRLSDLCKFCEGTINKIYTANFKAKFVVGQNTIRVMYEQPLSVSEISHGYFQSSKWSNSFAYELWPLREWKLDSKFEMNIKFTTEVGNAWSRFWGKKILAECRGIDLRFVKSPSATFKNQSGENGFKAYYEYNQNLNPNYIFSSGSKTYYESDNLVYELSLKEKFPDRLSCFFGQERN